MERFSALYSIANNLENDTNSLWSSWALYCLNDISFPLFSQLLDSINGVSRQQYTTLHKTNVFNFQLFIIISSKVYDYLEAVKMTLFCWKIV